MDNEALAAIELLKSEILAMRTERDSDRPFPVWPNQRVSHFIPGKEGDYGSAGDQGNNGENGENINGAGPSFSFRGWIDDATTALNMETGDVVLGPMTWIHWSDITGHDTTPAVNSTDVCVWLEVTITKGSEAATMQVGSRSAMESALDSTEQETTEVVPIIETTWTDGVLTKVKNLQCGDVKISRGAG